MNYKATSLEHGNKLIKLATYAAVVTALILVVSKLYAWRVTKSVSLQASLVDSILDTFASVVNFFVVRRALKPADERHRFGHGKAESLAGLGQSAFIAGSALWLLFDIAQRFWQPEPIVQSELGSKVMLLAVGLTIVLVLFQRYVVRKTGSIAIRADSVHYQSDLLTNLGVLVSLNISVYLGWDLLDPIVGGAIAVYILYTSYDIARDSLKELMDHELSEEERSKIHEIALDHPKVLGIHDLRTRSAGRTVFIQLHVDLDHKLSLKVAHDIAEEVEHNIIAAFPNAEVIIHQDPKEITKK